MHARTSPKSFLPIARLSCGTTSASSAFWKATKVAASVEVAETGTG